MYLKFSMVVRLFLLKAGARGFIILLTSRSKSGIIYIENKKERLTNLNHTTDNESLSVSRLIYGMAVRNNLRLIYIPP